MKPWTGAVVILVASGVTGPMAEAAEVHWLSDDDGAWVLAEHWSSAPALPGAGDAVVIDRRASPTRPSDGWLVTLDSGAHTIGELLLAERLALLGAGAALSVEADIELHNALLVADGGVLGSTGATILAGADDAGLAEVRNLDSRWHVADRLELDGREAGDAAAALLRVADGARVNVGSTLLVQGSAVVDLPAGATLSGVPVRPMLIEGHMGGIMGIGGGAFGADFASGGPAASLDILDGGRVTAYSVAAAYNLADVASVAVAGEASALELDRMTVAVNGQATLTVSDGGRVVIGEVMNIGWGPAAVGQVEIRDAESRLEVGSELRVGDVSGATGSLGIDQQAIVEVAGTVLVRPTGRVDVLDGRLEVGTLSSAGRVALASAGQLSIAGDLELEAGSTLSIGIHGAGHGWVEVDGLASLGGTLALAPAPGAPVHDELTLLTAAGIDGQFTVVLDDAVVGRWHALVRHEPDRVLATLYLLGDMNLDGVVDTGDVAPFILALTDPGSYMSQYGIDQETMIALGDINRDGAFDTGDVAPLVQLLVGGGSQSVPEPGSLALLGLGAMALLRRSRP